MKAVIEVTLANANPRKDGTPTLEQLALPEFDITAVLTSNLKGETFGVHGVAVVISDARVLEV